jgi:hypothetical protein
MVTLALVAMCGIMGLAVDLGWAYYVEKTSQAAADAAAIAAVAKAFDLAGGPAAEDGAYAGFVLPTTRCSSITDQPWAEGCLYAQRNGFQDNPSGRQAVYMTADANSVPPTVPRVGSVEYWATAVVAERIPQLFSAVMGNTMGGASSRATAAVVWREAPGSLYALDRQFDPGTPSGGVGNDFFITGGGAVWTGGDLYMASTAGPGGPAPPPGAGKDYYAAEGEGGWEIWSQGGDSFIRDTGWATVPENFFSGPDKVQTDPINGLPDSQDFYDPLAGRGQPPPPPAGLPDCPIQEVKVGSETFGLIKATPSPFWGSGNYYAVDAAGNATGNRLLVEAGVKFTAGSGSCQGGPADPSGFGNFVFFGGVKLPSGTVTFEPGRYVFAGVLQEKNGTPGFLVDGRTQTYLDDNTPLDYSTDPATSRVNQDAGEIFIFTDPSYQGGPTSSIPLQVPTAVQTIASQLKFGIVDLHSGSASTKTEMNLHGLNKSSSALPDELKNFEPVVFWQDQRNSTIPYTGDGYYYCGQTSGPACVSGDIDHIPWTNITNGSPEMNLQATPSTHLFGVVYQPRGAWMILHGGNDQVTSPLVLISGAFQIQGGPAARLQPVSRKLKQRVVALVE